MDKNELTWKMKYEALREYVLEHGHLPHKRMVENRSLLNWAKYNRKKINAATLDPERQRLFEELMAMRSTEHTGGRRRKEQSTSIFNDI